MENEFGDTAPSFGALRHFRSREGRRLNLVRFQRIDLLTMAIIRKTLKHLEAQKLLINAKLMKATSESDTRRQAVEDCDDLALPLPDYTLNLVREARAKPDMTQAQMAALIKSQRQDLAARLTGFSPNFAYLTKSL